MKNEPVIQVPGEGDFCVLMEAIVGAFGLPADKPFVGIKGDPPLRETAPIRSKFESRIDLKVGPALERIEWLLSETGCYALYVGFNSSEVRTESIFNPFNYEITLNGCILSISLLTRPARRYMTIQSTIPASMRSGMTILKAMPGQKLS